MRETKFVPMKRIPTALSSASRPGVRIHYANTDMHAQRKINSDFNQINDKAD
jgi:hypothetical protein